MHKIKDRLQEYFKKSSKWKIAGDIIFYTFIILMIIPATRKPISTTIIKLTMGKPKVETTVTGPMITSQDLQITMEDMEGNPLRLGDFQGEVILLNFWATWCPPCRAEMPSIQELYNDYGDKIAMLLVSSEEKPVIRTYLEEHDYDLPVFIQRSALTSTFPVRSIPTTYLINKKGEILLEKKGAANWNAKDFREQLDALLLH